VLLNKRLQCPSPSGRTTRSLLDSFSRQSAWRRDNCSKTSLVCPLAANIAAESTDRAVRMRLYDWTKDPCMQEILSYSVGRNTIHQQLWLASIRAKSAGAPANQ